MGGPWVYTVLLNQLFSRFEQSRNEKLEWGREMIRPPLRFFLAQIKCEGKSPGRRRPPRGVITFPHPSERQAGRPAEPGRTWEAPQPCRVSRAPQLVCWEALASAPTLEPRLPHLKCKGFPSCANPDALLGPVSAP